MILDIKISQHVMRNVVIVVIAITNALLSGAVPNLYAKVLLTCTIERFDHQRHIYFLPVVNEFQSRFFGQCCTDLWWVVRDRKVTPLQVYCEARATEVSKRHGSIFWVLSTWGFSTRWQPIYILWQETSRFALRTESYEIDSSEIDGQRLSQSWIWTRGLDDGQHAGGRGPYTYKYKALTKDDKGVEVWRKKVINTETSDKSTWKKYQCRRLRKWRWRQPLQKQVTFSYRPECKRANFLYLYPRRSTDSTCMRCHSNTI